MKIKTCHKNCITLTADMKIQQGTLSKNCITLIADMKIQQGIISDQSDLEQSEERRECAIMT